MDNQIREIFTQKLAEHESAVRPELWNAVQAQLAAPAAGSSAIATAAKVGLSKLWWAAAIVAITTAVGVIAYFTSTEEATNVNAPAEQNALIDVKKGLVEELVPVNANAEAKAESEIQRTEVIPIAQEKVQEVLKSSSLEEVLPSIAVIEPEFGVDIKPMEPNKGAMEKEGTLSGEKVFDVASANFKVVTVSEKDLRFFFIPENVKAFEYEWNFGDGTSSDEMSPSHTFDEEGEFTVLLNTYTSNLMLVATHAVQVKAFKPAELIIPNVFTPNGDGKNDAFVVEAIDGSATITKIIILNNEGRVFESDGSIMWDGRMPNGEIASSGTFTYLVRAIDKNQTLIEKTGTVTLLRN